MSKRTLAIVIGLLIVSITAVLAYIGYLALTPVDAVVESDDAYNGVTVLDPPQFMPDFTLTNHDGEAVDLRDLRGTFVLMSFGFTHCPDICPLTLGEMRRIHDALGDDADGVQFTFISVDGSRDTPDVLDGYFETMRIDGFMLGLTGDSELVRTLGRDYGVDFYYGQADDNGNYTVDHTAGMFLLDANNQWVRRYAFGTNYRTIVADLQDLLATEDAG